ncbi:MAG: ATP-binding protein [Mangrovibacterium sp.]
MKKYTIYIGQPQSDSFGASLQQLLPVLEQYDRLTKSDCLIEFNLLPVKFIHPFLILPVAALIQKTKDNGNFSGFLSAISSYLDKLAFSGGILSAEYNMPQKLLDQYRSKTYLPVCDFPTGLDTKSIEIRDQLLDSFNALLSYKLALTGSMRSVISYLITEAIDNIVEHAHCEKGWMMVQYYPQKGYLDLCICDLGIGLLQSYLISQKYPDITTHEKAIHEAIHGKSTKNIPENRGFGLSTSRTMLVEGLNGKYFMYSGDCFYVWTDMTEQITQTPEKVEFPGTMLSMRIPRSVPPGFNFYDFVG